MSVERIGPVYQQLNNHYNLRSRENIRPRERYDPDRPRQNLNNQHMAQAAPAVAPGVAPAGAPAVLPAVAPAVAPIVAPVVAPAHVVGELGRFNHLQKFSGTVNENANFWLQKFEALCHRQGIIGDDRLESFILLISGPCENWYMMLPHADRANYANLRAAFLDRFVNNNNIAECDLFYSKKQKQNEPVSTYIDNMMSLGNKLRLDANSIIATIKCGLLEPIKIHVMSHNVNDAQALIQQAELAETYLVKPHGAQRVHFDTSVEFPTIYSTKTEQQIADLQYANRDIKSMIQGISQQFEKLQVNTNSAHVINRSRSPTPHRSQDRYMYETNDANARYFVNAALSMPFCDYCSSQGHLVANCKLRQMRTFTPQQDMYNRGRPRFTQYSQNQQCRPRFTQYTQPNQQYRPTWRNDGNSNWNANRQNFGQTGRQNFTPRNYGNNGNTFRPSNYNGQHLN